MTEKFIPEENEFEVTIDKKHFIGTDFSDIEGCALHSALAELGFKHHVVGSSTVGFVKPNVKMIDYVIIQDSKMGISDNYGENNPIDLTVRLVENKKTEWFFPVTM